MSLSVAENIFMVAGIIVVVGIFTLLGFMLYIAKTKIDIILSSLQNSPFSITLITLWHGGPGGRIRMVGEVCGILWRPKYHIQSGLLDPQDIENFPPKLKRQLLLTRKLMIYFGAAMVCLWLIAELGLV
ncbi:hypothetical protein [Pseudomonas sp. GL-B-19]|uniref:hypothetical protein n=1 Tax=Pseudomonas sp. GL-B-19 TaxID=2832393 RepID=UPI001CC10107|nr:hypothetical protein [Pseudomonas sp. GL-B-19]